MNLYVRAFAGTFGHGAGRFRDTTKTELAGVDKRLADSCGSSEREGSK